MSEQRIAAIFRVSLIAPSGRRHITADTSASPPKYEELLIRGRMVSSEWGRRRNRPGGFPFAIRHSLLRATLGRSAAERPECPLSANLTKSDCRRRSKLGARALAGS